MFGESESESPRTGSPWDGFLSKPDLEPPAVEAALTKSPRLFPKLVPEVEEGNVEYKLRLLNPSTERFTRLVTQLKWRLLEGGGQAYYELGVADSGQLVGLSRMHLEQSLQTLEEMAGEIGASVIIVKEIELPPALLDAVKEDGPRGKIADGAMRMHKVRVADYVETPPSSAGGDEESELSAPEVEEGSCCGSSTAELSPGVYTPRRPDVLYSRSVSVGDEADDSTSGDDFGVLAAGLEVASVYKPRPHRRRTPMATPTPPKQHLAPADEAFANDLTALHVASAPMDVSNHMYSVRKTEKWKKKELKRTPRTLVPLLVVDGDGQSGEDNSPVSASACVDTMGTSEHLKALDDLEVVATMLSLNDGPSYKSFPDLYGSPYPEAEISPVTGEDKVVCGDVMHNGILTPDDPTERRFIVEALVVRKMSIEEAFLDFVNI